jgi:hypothetical protein
MISVAIRTGLHFRLEFSRQIVNAGEKSFQFPPRLSSGGMVVIAGSSATDIETGIVTDIDAALLLLLDKVSGTGTLVVSSTTEVK